MSAIKGSLDNLMTRALCYAVLLFTSGCCGPRPAPPQPVIEAPAEVEQSQPETALIEREVLFGNPDKASARISPDGAYLGFLAPVNGVLNVWVGPIDDPDSAVPVTKDKKRGIRTYFFAYTSRHVVYLQDKDGDENWHVYAVDLETRETTDLTPLEGVRANIEAVSHKFPEEILVGLNDREPRYHDLHRVNLVTGERTFVEENQGVAGFITDDDYRVRFAVKMTDDGGKEILKPVESTKEKKAKGKRKGRGAAVKNSKKANKDGQNKWEPFIKIEMEDSLTTYAVDFDKTGSILYLLDSRDRNTAAFATLDLDTGERVIVADDPRADLQDLMIHPTEKTVEAVAFTYTRKEWKTLDSSVSEDFGVLSEVTRGDFEVVSRTLDDKRWIVAYLVDDGPVRYYLYNRENRQSRFLFSNRAALEDQPLVKMQPQVIESSDGLQLVSYLSLPAGSDEDNDGRPEEPLPMVLDVHGGPWARDSWGYNSIHQWFANRGYAVLSVNFRGSTGFGKEFVNAGNMEWAGKMHRDLTEAVEWATREKIALPEKVAIFGGSYGGYATLVGLTFTPGTFACGVDIVGPSNLITLLETIPPYWAPMIELFAKRVGDHRTEEGRNKLKERSPLTRTAQIERPLLIGQGANDPRVKKSESDQIVEAMQTNGIPVTYVLYPDEGHGFARPENRLSFYAVTEIFLAGCLGGRFETIGDDFSGSSITVPVGAEHIPGLQEALKTLPSASDDIKKPYK